jgi:hypothetical protein
MTASVYVVPSYWFPHPLTAPWNTTEAFWLKQSHYIKDELINLYHVDGWKYRYLAQ